MDQLKQYSPNSRVQDRYLNDRLNTWYTEQFQKQQKNRNFNDSLQCILRNASSSNSDSLDYIQDGRAGLNQKVKDFSSRQSFYLQQNDPPKSPVSTGRALKQGRRSQQSRYQKLRSQQYFRPLPSNYYSNDNHQAFVHIKNVLDNQNCTLKNPYLQRLETQDTSPYKIIDARLNSNDPETNARLIEYCIEHGIPTQETNYVSFQNPRLTYAKPWSPYQLQLDSQKQMKTDNLVRNSSSGLSGNILRFRNRSDSTNSQLRTSKNINYRHQNDDVLHPKTSNSQNTKADQMSKKTMRKLKSENNNTTNLSQLLSYHNKMRIDEQLRKKQDENSIICQDADSTQARRRANKIRKFRKGHGNLYQNLKDFESQGSDVQKPIPKALQESLLSNIIQGGFIQNDNLMQELQHFCPLVGSKSMVIQKYNQQHNKDLKQQSSTKLVRKQKSPLLNRQTPTSSNLDLQEKSRMQFQKADSDTTQSSLQKLDNPLQLRSVSDNQQYWSQANETSQKKQLQQKLSQIWNQPICGWENNDSQANLFQNYSHQKSLIITEQESNIYRSEKQVSQLFQNPSRYSCSPNSKYRKSRGPKLGSKSKKPKSNKSKKGKLKNQQDSFQSTSLSLE